MTIADLEHLAAMLAIVGGATWALGAKLGQIKDKLGEIKIALAVHVQKDDDTHKALEARVYKMEGRRGRR